MGTLILLKYKKMEKSVKSNSILKKIYIFIIVLHDLESNKLSKSKDFYN